jgi:hypothetical protein
VSIFRWLSRRNHAIVEPGVLRTHEAVERIVTLSPQLRLVPRYPKRLGAVVKHSLDYLAKITATLPAPIEASPRAWLTDPHIHAFFAAPNDVVQAISRSADLQNYFDRDPAMHEAFGVLSMAMTERHATRVKHENGVPSADAARTLHFDDHLVRLCGESIEDVRQAVIRLSLDQLAIEGLARMEVDASRGEKAEQDHALLKARLQLLERRRIGMQALVNYGSPSGVAELARVQAQIEENAQRLASLRQKSDALERQLERVCEVFAAPASYLGVTIKRFALDPMNGAIDHGAGAAKEIELRVARIPGNPPRTRALALVRVLRTDLSPREPLLDETNRLVT